MLTGWNQPATDCPALFNLDVLIVLNYLLRLQAVPPKVSGMLELKPQINCPGSEGSWGFQIWIYPPASFTLSVRHFSVIVSPVNTPCELFVVRTFVLHFACPQILWRYERFSAWSQNLWSRYRAVSVFHLPLLRTVLCTLIVLFLCSVLKQESRVTSLKRKQINNQPKSKFVKGLILSHGVFSYIYT